MRNLDNTEFRQNEATDNAKGHGKEDISNSGCETESEAKDAFKDATDDAKERKLRWAAMLQEVAVIDGRKT